MPRIAINLAIVVLLVFGAWNMGSAAHIGAKAWLAQALLKHSWASKLKDGTDVRPWPWADTFPFAELSVERLGIKQIVLTGDSGRILAFGPGYNEGSAKPGHPGITLVSAHRDTHFAFLKELKKDDILTLSTNEEVIKYRVEELSVVNAESVEARIEQEESYILLVTCYPFEDWVAGGALRYVVAGRAIGRG